MSDLKLATEALLHRLGEKLEGLALDLVSRPDNSARWFHGRGQLEPALAFLCVDFYDPVIQISLFHEPENGESWLENFVAALVALIEKLPNGAGLKAVNVQHLAIRRVLFQPLSARLHIKKKARVLTVA